ncbi:MAG: Lrp/AsnC family transcriptional regulator [Halobacteriaceae archaeon]
MVVAYILVKASTGEAERVRDELAAVEGVEDVHIVAGDVDFIARVSVENPAAVRQIAATGFQGIAGVADTETYIAME